MRRRAFLAGLLASAACRPRPTTDPEVDVSASPSSERMPVVFIGHGSPMNGIENNAWSEGWKALGGQLPTPKAVLSVSAHWETRGSFVTGMAWPQTIHDFSGFPPALGAMQYPAPGDPELAKRLAERIDAVDIDQRWGLDHGTWTVLARMYPDARIPVVQLSMDRRMSPKEHLKLANQLRELREEGVLVMGSGNVTHNLWDAIQRKRAGMTATPPEWASSYDQGVTQALLQHDVAGVLSLSPRSQLGQMAHPSAEHWLPLLYAMGATDEHDLVTFPVEGFDWGSLSMRSVVWS